MANGIFANVNGEYKQIADKVETVELSVDGSENLTVNVNGVSGTVKLPPSNIPMFIMDNYSIPLYVHTFVIGDAPLTETSKPLAYYNYSSLASGVLRMNPNGIGLAHFTSGLGGSIYTTVRTQTLSGRTFYPISSASGGITWDWKAIVSEGRYKCQLVSNYTYKGYLHLSQPIDAIFNSDGDTITFESVNDIMSQIVEYGYIDGVDGGDLSPGDVIDPPVSGNYQTELRRLEMLLYTLEKIG